MRPFFFHDKVSPIPNELPIHAKNRPDRRFHLSLRIMLGLQIRAPKEELSPLMLKHHPRMLLARAIWRLRDCEIANCGIESRGYILSRQFALSVAAWKKKTPLSNPQSANALRGSVLLLECRAALTANRSSASFNPQSAICNASYSHSIVAGGLELTS